MYAPFLLANAAALASGAERVECEIDGRPWVQQPFPYQGKCLAWLREAHAALAPADRARGGRGARRHRARAALRRLGDSMRRFLLALVALAVVGALAVFIGLRIPAVQDRLFAFALSRLTGTADEHFDDGAMRVLFCGTSSPLPHPTRAKACVAVYAGKNFWVVDTGPSSWNSAALSRIDGSKIGGVLITHFHSDHIGDLGEWNLQTWAAGRPGPLPVYGGPGIERVVAGFTEAYALDTGYRVAHHGEHFLHEKSSHMEAHPSSPASSSTRTACASPRSPSRTSRSLRPTATASTTAAARS